MTTAKGTTEFLFDEVFKDDAALRQRVRQALTDKPKLVDKFCALITKRIEGGCVEFGVIADEELKRSTCLDYLGLAVAMGSIKREEIDKFIQKWSD